METQLVGKKIMDNFCGAGWKSAGFKVGSDATCETIFANAFSKGIKGLSDAKLNPAGLSEIEVFLDSFQIVAKKAESLCKVKAGINDRDIKTDRLDEYLKCTSIVVAGKPIPRVIDGKSYEYLVYSGNEFPFERMVQYLHDRALIPSQKTHQALNIKDRAKSWPFLEKLYGEALKLTSTPDDLAPKIEYNILQWADRAEVLRPLANYVYVYEVKDDGQVVIKPVPEIVFDPRVIGLNATREELPGGYKRLIRNIFAEIRNQYFEKSNIPEFHPEIERRIAMVTVAYLKQVVLPDEAPLTFLVHVNENYTPALQLNSDRKSIKGMLWGQKGELDRANQVLTPSGIISFWRLARLWHQAEIAAYKNGVPIKTIVGEFHTKFANQLIDKFKSKLDGETEDDRTNILSRYEVETVKPDGTIVFD